MSLATFLLASRQPRLPELHEGDLSIQPFRETVQLLLHLDAHGLSLLRIAGRGDLERLLDPAHVLLLALARLQEHGGLKVFDPVQEFRGQRVHLPARRGLEGLDCLFRPAIGLRRAAVGALGGSGRDGVVEPLGHALVKGIHRHCHSRSGVLEAALYVRVGVDDLPAGRGVQALHPLGHFAHGRLQLFGEGTARLLSLLSHALDMRSQVLDTLGRQRAQKVVEAPLLRRLLLLDAAHHCGLELVATEAHALLAVLEGFGLGGLQDVHLGRQRLRLLEDLRDAPAGRRRERVGRVGAVARAPGGVGRVAQLLGLCHERRERLLDACDRAQVHLLRKHHEVAELFVHTLLEGSHSRVDHLHGGFDLRVRAIVLCRSGGAGRVVSSAELIPDNLMDLGHLDGRVLSLGLPRQLHRARPRPERRTAIPRVFRALAHVEHFALVQAHLRVVDHLKAPHPQAALQRRHDVEGQV
mmetsp:Transcript_19386/g.58060  ORF Transcript_19386/g.58060 Transcript_19386/m.58060 type:complete len:468 (+) Transcript_19386:288-1691(+)